MKNVLVEDAFRWMLAACMLLATSVASSTFVHRHTGGNVAHRHGTPNGALAHALHDDHDEDAGLHAGSVHCHGRIGLLGAVTHHAMPEGPCGSHEKSPCDWQAVVASVAHGIRTLSKGLAIDHSVPASAAIISMDSVSALQADAVSSAGTAATSFLCDRSKALYGLKLTLMGGVSAGKAVGLQIT